MKYEMVPVIDINDIEDALQTQFNINISGELAIFLFDEEVSNDSYNCFYFDEIEEYRGYSWENEERIRIRNCVKSILQDSLPDQKYCLIDVSW